MQKIYVFGDSIAQGIIVDENGHFRLSFQGSLDLLKHAGYPVINYAMDGYTAHQGLVSFRKKWLQPGSICVIEFGANDCELDWDGISADPEHFHDGRVNIALFIADLETFIQEARNRELKPVLVTPPPLMSYRYFPWICRGRNRANLLKYFRDDPESISRWEERYVFAIRELARKYDCHLLDLRNWLVHELDYPDLMCMDGSHPNARGYALIARRAMEHYPLLPQITAE